jgi:signal transduction histidine kinase
MTPKLKKIFDSLPGCYLIVLPDVPRFTIYDANDAYLVATKKDKDIIGKPLFEVFPDNPLDPQSTGVKNLTASLNTVLRTGRKHHMPIQRYDISTDLNTFEVRYWKPMNVPVHDEQHQIIFIIHCVEDVTRQANVGTYLKKRYREIQAQISEAVVTTQEIERMELSRELHDNTLQLLNTSRLYLERALQTQPPGEALIIAGMEMVTTAMDELRKIARTLVEPPEEKENLAALIDKLLSHITSISNISVTRTIHLPDEAVIGSKIKLSVLRIIQEYLNNVVSHSRAKNLWVSLSCTGPWLELTIKDDGVGFNMQESKRGLGLQNINERVAGLRGHIDLQSLPGNGCQMMLKIPV